MNASQEVAWIVSIILVEAAVIDGLKLRVPNWLTFHLVIAGLAYAAWSHGGAGFLWALAGMAVGLATLLPLYAIGGMGAGDVKLMAGVGAWVGPMFTGWAFLWSAGVGGVVGLAVMGWGGGVSPPLEIMRMIVREVLTVRSATVLSELAARRKPTMLLLPYGIPIAAGTIAYMTWAGFLV